MNTIVVVLIVLVVATVIGLLIWWIVVLIQKDEEGELPEASKSVVRPSVSKTKPKPKSYGTTQEQFDFSELDYDRWVGSDVLLTDGLSGVPMRPIEMTRPCGDVTILPYPQDDVLYGDPSAGYDTWDRQSRILANIIFILRQQNGDKALLRRYVLMLYYNQRVLAYLMIRRCGEDFARRYFELISRYLRLILTICLLRTRNMDCTAYHTETISVVVQLREMFVQVGGFEQIQIHLSSLAERVYVGNEDFAVRSGEPLQATSFFSAVLGGSVSPRATPIGADQKELEEVQFATPKQTVDEMMSFDD